MAEMAEVTPAMPRVMPERVEAVPEAAWANCSTKSGMIGWTADEARRITVIARIMVNKTRPVTRLQTPKPARPLVVTRCWGVNCSRTKKMTTAAAAAIIAEATQKVAR